MQVLARPGRLRDAAVCAALAVLAVLQQPGKIVPDTKIDLVVDPVQWMARALHLWDPSGSFGQVQNQAYGYLWPMGPFFALGTGVGMPGWLVQRLWWTLLLCLGYLGAVRLAEKLSIGTPASRTIAGIAFALSPRILTQLGAVSVEAWPSVIAPWVLIPLVGLASGTSIRRAVTLSALAVACAGGVNATAVFATVPLAFLWLWTLTPVRRRAVAIVAWCAAVLAATAWWLVPLLVLGRYSPPFLDYIETAATTTWVTDPVTVLRGASYWPAWLDDPYVVQDPAGWMIARTLVPAAASMALAVLGLVGLARRGMPHRRVLLTGLLVGFALVSLGHQGGLAGTFAEQLRAFLDGAGAPLRNVHKFDVLLRLPLVLGVAHLIGVLSRARVKGPARLRHAGGAARLLRGRAPGLAVAGGTVVVIMAVATPAFTGTLPAPQGFKQVPDYWRSAASWLNERSDEGRVLVLPGVRFPRYVWGDTLDEITQPLLHGPAAVRNVIPLSPATTIRMMDAVESVLATGAGSPALGTYLARAGVSYVLVRNDLHYGRGVTTSPLLAAQALDRSSGLTEVATFGPDVVSPTPADARDELGVALPALRILRVEPSVARAVTYPAGQVATVVGGPESLLWLAEAGLLPAGPVELAGDLAGGKPTAGPMLVTDGLRLVDRSFGGGREPISNTLTVEQAVGAKDLLPSWGPQWTVPAVYQGVAEIRASSARSEENPAGDSLPGDQPYAAFDGDPSTWWLPAINVAERLEWVEVTLPQEHAVSQVTIHFAPWAATDGMVTRAAVEVDGRRFTADVVGTTAVVAIDPPASTRTIRVSADAFQELVKEGTFGIAEVQIPGVRAARTLVVPAPPAGSTPATVLLTAAPSTPACFLADSPSDPAVRCSRIVARTSDDGSTLDRTISLTAGAAYAPSVWAQARAGAALDALLDSLRPGGPTVRASSATFTDPAARPGVVVDGDPTTTWRAGPYDADPSLRFVWSRPQTISGLRLSLATSDTAALGTPAGGVTVVAGDRRIEGDLVDGELHFGEPVTTTEMTVHLRPGPGVRAFDTYQNKVLAALPVAVSEVTFLGSGAEVTTALAPDLDAALDLACGTGPTLTVDGRETRTRLQASARDLLEHRAVPAVACTGEGAPLDLGAGTHRVVATSSDLATTTRVALVPADAAPTLTTGPTSLAVGEWSATRRTVTLDPHDEDLVLAVRENTNIGWVATIDGIELTPVVLDGWQQGWVVPAGLAGQVELRYAPDTTYRAGIFTGFGLLLAVLVVCLLPRRGSRADIAPANRRVGALLLLVTGVGAFVVTAGVLGGVIAATGLVAYAVGRRRPAWARAAAGRLAAWDQRYPGLRPRSLARLAQWLAGPLLLVLASAAWIGAQAGNYHWVPQVLGILAVAVIWVQALASAPRA